MNTTFNGRKAQHINEDDLKILKVEYLSNRLLEHTQILKLSLYDQTPCCQILQMKTTSNGRQPYNIKKWNI